MKTSKIFRYLFMAVFTLSYSLAWGQKTIQLRLEGNNTPPVINAYNSNGTKCDKQPVTGVSDFTYNSSNRTYYVKTGIYPGAAIEVKGFNYNIKEITLRCKANSGTGTIATRIVDGTGEEWAYQHTITFNSSYGNYLFYGGDFEQVKGLSKLYIQATGEKACYVQYINITYYEPEIIANEQFPHTMQIGNIVDLKNCYNIQHADFFRNVYMDYSSSNPNIISVDENGIMKAVGNGTASITLTLRDRDNNGSELTHMVFNIESSKFSVDSGILSYHCHHEYEDEPSGNNGHDLSSINVNQLKSEWERDGKKLDQDYSFNRSSSKNIPSGYSSLGQLVSTTSKRYRVGLQKVNLVVTPPHTTYKADVSFSVYIANRGSSIHGAGVIMSKDGKADDYDNVTLKTNGTSNTTFGNNVEDYFCLAETSGRNVSGNSSKYELNIYNGTNNPEGYYAALISYVQHTSAKHYQTTDFGYKFENEQFTYHANIIYDMPDGCPFDMPTPNPWAVSSHTPDDFVTLPEIEQIADYKFAGWSTMPNGMVEYENGGKFYPYNPMTGGGRGDVHLYAVWGKVKATVKPEILNGEDIAKSSAEHRYIGLKIGSECSISGFTGECYIKDELGNYLTSVKASDQDLWSTTDISQAALWDVQRRNVNGEFFYTFQCISEDNKNAYLSTDVLTNELGDIDDPKILWSISPDGHMYIKASETMIKVLDNHAENHAKWQISFADALQPWHSVINVESYSVGDGIVSSKNVISAINTKLSAAGNQYSYMVSGATSDADKYKGILYVDMTALKQVVESSDSKWNAFQNSTAKNAIFFLPVSNPKYDVDHNFVWKNGSGFTATVKYKLTDAEPFYSPYDYNAQSLEYKRSFASQWGTICLPFQLKNDNQNIKYYQLDASNDLQMAFAPYSGNISANMPIVCCAKGNIDVNYSNVNINKTNKASLVHSVTVNKYDAETGSKDSRETISWQLYGTIFDRKIFGQSETAYYFSNNQLRYVNPNGSVKMLPLRGYFKPGGNSGIKPFSFVVLDEEGATDITNIVNGNDDVSDGKIYDLSGRRVKSPIKGHIYIVNGNKKMY